MSTGGLHPAMSNRGGSNMNAIGVDGNARLGGADLGHGTAAALSNAEMAGRMHYVPPALVDETARNSSRDQYQAAKGNGFPAHMGNFDGLSVPYSGPSPLQENMVLRQQVRDAVPAAAGGAGSVVRTDPITDTEVAYLKQMKDQVELANFDNYVESLVDPRMPGNMKWLMEVYPDYVNRRLQQAHTDYEYALRNQMIDSWGINTFDDLHFKYLVDQGKIAGPSLQTTASVDATYTPGYLSPFKFQRTSNNPTLFLPYNSAKHGRAPAQGQNWSIDRSSRPLGGSANPEDLARAMYTQPPATAP